VADQHGVRIANYSAAESYILTFGEAVHHELAPKGVTVTVLVPGATDPPMLTRFGADQTSVRRLIMPVETCVNDGLNALVANRAARISGTMNRITTTTLPRSARTRLFGSMNRSMAEQASRKAVAR
jgi:short-subunit dehydrogenase